MEDESSPQSSSLTSWPVTGCMLSLNIYVIYLLFRTDDDVDVEYITILLISLFRLHFCRNHRLIRNFRIYYLFLFLYI